MYIKRGVALLILASTFNCALAQDDGFAQDEGGDGGGLTNDNFNQDQPNNAIDAGTFDATTDEANFDQDQPNDAIDAGTFDATTDEDNFDTVEPGTDEEQFVTADDNADNEVDNSADTSVTPGETKFLRPPFKSVSLDDDEFESFVIRRNGTAQCVGLKDTDTSDPIPITEPCDGSLSQLWLRIANDENQGQWQNRLTYTCLTVPYNDQPTLIMKTCSATTLNNQKILDDALIAPRPNTESNLCIVPCDDDSGDLCTFEAGTEDTCNTEQNDDEAFNYELYAEPFCDSPVSDGRWEIDLYGECSATCDSGMRPVTYTCSSLREFKYACCGEIPENNVPCNSVPCGANVNNYKVIKSTASLEAVDANPLCIDAVDPTHVEMRPCSGADSQLFIQIDPKQDKQWVNKATGNCIQVPERYNMDKRTDFIFMRPCQTNTKTSDDLRYQQFYVDELVESRVRTCLSPCNELNNPIVEDLDAALVSGFKEVDFFNPVPLNKESVCAVRDDDEGATSWCQAGSFSYLGLEIYNNRMEDQLWCKQEKSEGEWRFFGQGQCSKECGGGSLPLDYRCIPTDSNVETACCGSKDSAGAYLCNAQPCNGTLDDIWVLLDSVDRTQCATTTEGNALVYEDCVQDNAAQQFTFFEGRKDKGDSQQWYNPESGLCVTVNTTEHDFGPIVMANCSLNPLDTQFFAEPTTLVNTGVGACLAPCDLDPTQVCAFNGDSGPWCRTTDVPKNDKMEAAKYCSLNNIDCSEPTQTEVVVTSFTTVTGELPTQTSLETTQEIITENPVVTVTSVVTQTGTDVPTEVPTTDATVTITDSTTSITDVLTITDTIVSSTDFVTITMDTTVTDGVSTESTNTEIKTETLTSATTETAPDISFTSTIVDVSTVTETAETTIDVTVTETSAQTDTVQITSTQVLPSPAPVTTSFITETITSTAEPSTITELITTTEGAEQSGDTTTTEVISTTLDPSTTTTTEVSFTTVTRPLSGTFTTTEVTSTTLDPSTTTTTSVSLTTETRDTPTEDSTTTTTLVISSTLDPSTTTTTSTDTETSTLPVESQQTSTVVEVITSTADASTSTVTEVLTDTETPTLPVESQQTSTVVEVITSTADASTSTVTEVLTDTETPTLPVESQQTSTVVEVITSTADASTSTVTEVLTDTETPTLPVESQQTSTVVEVITSTADASTSTVTEVSTSTDGGQFPTFPSVDLSSSSSSDAAVFPTDPFAPSSSSSDAAVFPTDPFAPSSSAVDPLAPSTESETESTTETSGGTDGRVDGLWSEWSECSVTCSFGIQTRTCTEPEPSNGGDTCPGPAIRTCSPGPCSRADFPAERRSVRDVKYTEDDQRILMESIVQLALSDANRQDTSRQAVDEVL